VQQLETENLSLQQRLDGGTLPATPTSDSVHQQLVQERHTTAQLEQELVNVKLAAEEAQREARHYFDQIQRQKQQITELQRQVTVGHLERADPDLQAARPEQSFGSRTGQPNGREEEVQIALAELRQQLEADKERALAEQRRAFEETALAEARDVAVKDASDISASRQDAERLAFESKIAAAMATTEAQKAYIAAKQSGEEVKDAQKALTSWAYQ
jgi:hypothetical protein